MKARTLFQIVFFLFLIVGPLKSMAMVDMRNANYSHTWIDLTLPSNGIEFSIRRTYNSRSLFDGMFGFGWCTTFESKLEFTAEGNIELVECGGGLALIFKPRDFSFDQVKETVSQIVTKHKSENPKKTSEEIAKFQEELMTNEALRAQHARTYKMDRPVKEGAIYYAEGARLDRFEKKNRFFYRYFEDGTYHKYSENGLMVGMYDKGGNYLQFNRSDNLIVEIVDNFGKKVLVKYYPNRKVKLLEGNNGSKATYKFTNNDLTEVVNGWGNTFTYSYDLLHNMTKVIYPDKTFKVLTYNEKKDWVMSFQDRKGCIEKYDYQMSEDEPKDHYWSSVVKTCKGKVTAKSRYEFWHKTRKDGRGKYLDRVRFVVDDKETEMVFHPDLGDPLYVKKDGSTLKYAYYPNGALKAKYENDRYSIYEYKGDEGHVSSVKTFFYGAQKKIVKKRRTDFVYDKRGNIIKARNTDGQMAWIKYDEKDRITIIKDQSKKVVKIEYEGQFGKPSVVTRPGVGTIKIIYDDKGDMKDIESKSGPIVAQEVASTFNNLLEVISPGISPIQL